MSSLNATDPPSNYLEAFCGEKVWDPTFFNHSSIPTVSQCFSHTFMVWIPCLLVYLLAPLHIYHISVNKKDELPWTQLLSAKFSLTLIMLINCGFIFFYNVYEAVVTERIVSVDLVYPVMLGSSMALIIMIILACQKYGRITSGPIYMIWVAFGFCGIPELYYWIYHGSSTHQPLPLNQLPKYISYLIWYFSVMAQIVISSFADIPGAYEKISFENDENISPETFSSFLNRQCLWWFHALCKLGKERPLELGDLFNLNKNDTSEFLVPRWEKLWEKAMKAYEKKIEKEKRTKRKRRTSNEHNRHESDAQPLLENEEMEVSTETIVTFPSSNQDRSYGSTRYSGKEESPTTSPIEPPSIIKHLFVMFRYEIIVGMVAKLICDSLTFVNPQLLKKLIKYMEIPDAPLWYGFLLAGAMFAASELSSLFINSYYYIMYRVGTRIQTTLTAAVFRKTLKLSNASRKNKTTGEIVNLMAIDVDRFQQITPQTHQFFSTPYQITLAMIFLWQIMGPSVMSGIAVMLIVFPINFVFSLIIKKYQTKQMELKDERIKMVNEVLNGIKVIKLYGWEVAMEEAIVKIRNKELEYIKKASFLRTFSDMLNQASPFLVALSTFATYILIDSKNVLTPEIAFVSLTLFNQLRTPMGSISELISTTVQVVVSNNRLRQFLVMEEMQNKIEREFKSGIQPTYAVEVKQGTFKWDKNATDESENAFSLKNVNLKVERGAFVAIVGKVGAGKSSVLQSLLGEMELVKGKVKIDGQVAYHPQTPWIQNNTIRGNILFGARFDEFMFERILNATCLIDDLPNFINSDLTEIGEKGANLSGGTKARISLARAAYQNSDIYFLDDPLSAVDSHVGSKIFNDVIGSEGLLKHKTRFLVTNNMNYMVYTDMILVVEQGEIVLQGSYNDLIEQDRFKDLLKECESEREQMEARRQEAIDEEDIEDMLSETDSDNDLNYDDNQAEINFGTSHMSTVSAIYTHRKMSLVVPKARKRKLSCTTKSAVSTDYGFNSKPTSGYERTETGKVKWSIYTKYFQSMGLFVAFLFIAGLTFSTIASIFRNLWLTDWSNDNAKAAGAAQSNSTVHITSINTRLGIYALIGFSEIFLTFIGLSSLLLGGILASKNLHAPLLHAIFRAPMSFFDTTPFGRIINRVNKDIETIDFLLPFNIQFFTSCNLQVLSTLTIIILSTPTFGLVIIPLGYMYFKVLMYYIATSRQLKRLESVTRSPIYSHLSESLAGAFTIRSYRLLNKFCKLSEQKVDTHVRCRYLNNIANRYLSVRLEFIGNSIVLFAALFAVLMKGSISAGIIGLSISYSLNITGALNAAVRQITKLETNVVSVERVCEYSEIKAEASWTSLPEREPAQKWPQQGKIDFINYSTRYRQGLDLVLRKVNASIMPGQKIGIVGRTGSGKSSLVNALFRMIEAVEGKIIIDGIDISTIGLHDLRSRITIIPQESVLVSTTLKLNMDPFGMYSDDAIWRALELAHLKDFIVSYLPNGLETFVDENYFSIGRLQLLGLAKSLLKKENKILVLDECTSSLDQATDQLIQETIRTEFASCTVLTIAHRIQTVLDYNKIMVMDQGKIIEFDSPSALLANKHSTFYSMAQFASLI